MLTFISLYYIVTIIRERTFSKKVFLTFVTTHHFKANQLKRKIRDNKRENTQKKMYLTFFITHHFKANQIKWKKLSTSTDVAPGNTRLFLLTLKQLISRVSHPPSFIAHLSMFFTYVSCYAFPIILNFHLKCVVSIKG